MALQRMFMSCCVFAMRTLIWFIACMHTHMSFETTVLGESLITLFARKWSFLGVGAKMGKQVGFVSSFVVTLKALVWLDTIMYCTYVSGESGFVDSCIVALRAPMWLDAFMDCFHMLIEMARLCKPFVTVVAREWSLLGVSAVMNFQMRSGGSFVVTFGASVLLEILLW